MCGGVEYFVQRIGHHTDENPVSQTIAEAELVVSTGTTRKHPFPCRGHLFSYRVGFVTTVLFLGRGLLVEVGELLAFRFQVTGTPELAFAVAVRFHGKLPERGHEVLFTELRVHELHGLGFREKQ